MEFYTTLIFAIALGLVIGSFLNVLIFRGPALWGLVDVEEPRGSLWGPRSQCPACKTVIKSWHNIPVLSYIFLRGKCANCGVSISLRYPLVEILGGIAAGICFIMFGWSIAALLASIFLFALIALGFIDHETGYLPDMITYPVIIIGLIANFASLYVAPLEGLVGAIAGFAAFWGIALYYYLTKGQEGLGLGDAKLLAGLGAWCGWVALAPIVMISSVGALIWLGLSALRGRKLKGDTVIHFGPALTIGGSIIFIAQHWPGN